MCVFEARKRKWNEKTKLALTIIVLKSNNIRIVNTIVYKFDKKN